MAQTLKNPFVITGYISPEYFCDRGQETQTLISNITNGRNTALISERRMGKTGLVEHVYHRRDIQKDYHTFHVDIYATGSLREFVFLMGKHIFETLKPRGRKFIDGFFSTITSLRPALKFDTITGSPVFDIGLGEILQPETSLEQIFSYLEKADKRCIVAIDEFQQIARYPEKNIEALLRTHIQRCKNTNFIFAGSIHHMMHDIFFKASRPFYQSVSVIKLGPIDPAEYVSFVSGFFTKAGISISEQEILSVYRLLDGHTWYMQTVFNELYAVSSKGDTIDAGAVSRAVRKVMMSYEEVYKAMMSTLAERQKEVLIAIARERNAKEITSGEFIKKHGLMSSSSVQSAVNQLIKKEIVMKQEEGYVIPDRFFALWINTMYGTGFDI